MSRFFKSENKLQTKPEPPHERPPVEGGSDDDGRGFGRGALLARQKSQRC